MIEITNILEVENHINDVAAVIFDLDDTLYSEKEYVRSGYKKIAEKFNLSQLESELWSAFEKGGQAIDEVLSTNNMIEKKAEALHIYRTQQPDIHLYEGVLDMITRIRKEKKVGIITDGRPEGQRAKLLALGLDVDKIIITDELGGIKYRKPNTVAFEMMQKTLGVAFKDMVYVGDNIAKDFVAPNKLGMKSMWFRNPEGIYIQLK